MKKPKDRNPTNGKPSRIYRGWLQRHGMVITYYKNAGEMYRGNFVNDLADGYHVEKNPNGTVTSKTLFIN